MFKIDNKGNLILNSPTPFPELFDHHTSRWSVVLFRFINYTEQNTNLDASENIPPMMTSLHELHESLTTYNGGACMVM